MEKDNKQKGPEQEEANRRDFLQGHVHIGRQEGRELAGYGHRDGTAQSAQGSVWAPGPGSSGAVRGTTLETRCGALSVGVGVTRLIPRFRLWDPGNILWSALQVGEHGVKGKR